MLELAKCEFTSQVGSEGVERGLELSQETHEGVEADQEERLALAGLHNLGDTRNLAVTVIIPMAVLVHLDANHVGVGDKIDEIGPTINVGTSNSTIIVGVHLERFVLIQKVLHQQLQLLHPGRPLAAAEARETFSSNTVKPAPGASNTPIVPDTGPSSCLCAIRTPFRDTTRPFSVDSTPSHDPGDPLGILATGHSMLRATTGK